VNDGRTGGVGEQRGEPLNPAVDGDVIDLHATLDQELLNVAIGQVEPQIPAHRDHDHLRREPEAGERRLRWQPQARAGSMTSLLKSASILPTLNATEPVGPYRWRQLGAAGTLGRWLRGGTRAASTDPHRPRTSGWCIAWLKSTMHAAIGPLPTARETLNRRQIRMPSDEASSSCCHGRRPVRPGSSRTRRGPRVGSSHPRAPAHREYADRR
jgi:hypothetical protein